MKLLRLICCAVLGFAAAHAESPVPLSVTLEKRLLALEASGNGRDQLILTLRNSSPSALDITIPAGLIATGQTNTSRVINLRTAAAHVPAASALEVALPVAALTSKNTATPQSFTLTNASEPQLAALLQTLADQPDAPRSTAQLAVLALLEDLSFAQWRQFLGLAGEAQPTPAEVTQAIDALGLLRLATPQRTFALAADPDLKLRALRNPWCRAKAMLVYGLDLGDGAVPPDLRQLLHTAPGDNCPICRQRALLEAPANAP